MLSVPAHCNQLSCSIEKETREGESKTAAVEEALELIEACTVVFTVCACESSVLKRTVRRALESILQNCGKGYQTTLWVGRGLTFHERFIKLVTYTKERLDVKKLI